ncbi:MAG: UDP-N-acetylmuramoyl-L-alanyl-D-glutamate--2,6-diaminopimelate ligase [Dissulfurispiraceae bacterium]
MKLRDILPEHCILQGDIDREVEGISYDSRKVKTGDIFVAIKGEHFDGHNFIEDAISNGAVAIGYEKETKDISAYRRKYHHASWIRIRDARDAIAALSHNFYGRPSEELSVIGITGTNGKTTTSYLLKSILEKSGQDVGLVGTIAYLIKDMAHEASHTTPEAPDFQSLLREMANKGCRHVITEVSSHALSQNRVDYTRFMVAVFTNLTRDHLDYHETMEDYFKAKSKLFTELLPDNGSAIVNRDDPYGEKLITLLEAQRVKSVGLKRRPDGEDSGLVSQSKRIVTYSLKHCDADTYAFDIRTTFKGSLFKLKTTVCDQVLEDEIFSPLIGIKNVYNVLAAISAALSLAVPLWAIKEGIARLDVVKGRLEKVDLGQKFLAVVDYAHTEDALEGLLMTARHLLGISTSGETTEGAARSREKLFPQTKNGKGGKIITVFGCGGNRDRGKRPMMGNIAVRLSDFVIVTSDNPRDEEPQGIMRDIEQGMKADNYVVIEDRGVAINMAVDLASPGDIIIIAGKGHEEYQEIRGTRHPFRDKVTLENAIKRVMSKTTFRSNR